MHLLLSVGPVFGARAGLCVGRVGGGVVAPLHSPQRLVVLQFPRVQSLFVLLKV